MRSDAIERELEEVQRSPDTKVAVEELPREAEVPVATFQDRRGTWRAVAW